MAHAVVPGRYTAEVGPQGAVVFLIGMRFNRWWRVDRWWPVCTAMPRMLRHLAADPESGLLGYHLWFGRTALVLQYWRSTEDRVAFASDPHAPPPRRRSRCRGRCGRRVTRAVRASGWRPPWRRVPNRLPARLCRGCR